MDSQASPMMDEDLSAYICAIGMLEHVSPFGHVLGALQAACGLVDAMDGFAAFASEPPDLDPEAGLNPAFASLSATAAWRRIQPRLADELREKRGRISAQAQSRPLPKAKTRP